MVEMSLTAEQKERIERNRQKALELRARSAPSREAAASSSSTTQQQSQYDRLQEIILKEFDREEQEEKAAAEKAATESVIQCQYVEDGIQCIRCGIDKILYEAFQEAICSVCKLKTNDYDLLTKNNAATEYLLPEDVFRILPYHTKNNPFNAGWTPMKLFLRKHLKDLALRRYGSMKNLEEERKKRDMKKFKKNLNQTNAILSETAEEYRSSLTAAGNEEPPTAESEIDAGSERYAIDVTNKKRRQKNLLSNANSKKRRALNDFLTSIRGDEK